MGGLFPLPKPPRPSSAPPLPAVSPGRPNLMKLERDQRLEALQRQRRGRSGMIATSSRGLLAESTVGEAKRLLGE